MRHYCANPTMSENGEPAGGLVGFLKSLGPLCDQFNPTQVIVVWESGGNQKRRAMSSGSYKDGRKPAKLNRYYEDDIPNTVENHNNQISLLIEALKSLPVRQIYVKDTEADDVIGYICNYKFKESKIVVVSSDRDLYQLIDDRVLQWSLNQKKLIDSNSVIEKFGVSPQNFCVARCFTGDASDSIEGVKGAGFRTLAKKFPELIKEDFFSVSDLVERSKELAKSSGANIYKSIIEGEEDAKKNWKLMHLDISRLNGDQIKRIEYQLGISLPSSNKISLLRLLVREGLKSVDLNSTFATLKRIPHE
jgi:DNA polymerase-1